MPSSSSIPWLPTGHRGAAPFWRHRIVPLALLIALAGCAADGTDADPVGDKALAEGATFDPAASAPAQSQLFAAAWIASPVEDRDSALSPDGTLFLFSRMGPRSAILMLERGETAESDPEPWHGPLMAPFSGLHGDLEPAFTPDGSRLWFASDRPAPDGENYGHDLWWVAVGAPAEGSGARFGEPQRPGAPLNTEGNEFYPSLTREGVLYFTTTREGGVGSEDIWRSRPEGEGWSEPECLGEGVNSASFEFNAFIAPDESYLLFTRWLPEGDFGGGDLYVSFRREDGSWTEALNLGETVNTTGLDYCPFVSPDGRNLFFSRKRGRAPAEHPTGKALDHDAYMRWTLGPGSGAGDIYWISATILEPLRTQALAP